MTPAFWLRGDVHRHDLAGYAVAQTLGALASVLTLPAPRRLMRWTPAAVAGAPGIAPLTAKLCHDRRYRSCMRTRLPARKA